jgi:CelD/BcsL family acetyltransferase involved in cellulose biosynthesis
LSIAKPQESSRKRSGALLRARIDAQFEALRPDVSGGGELSRNRGLETRWMPIARLQADPTPWRELVRRAIEPNVFLEPGFALAAAQRFADSDLGVLAAYAGPRLVGLLPGRVEGIAAGRPVPMFVAWTHPFAPLSTPLIDRDFTADAVPALMSAMSALPGAPKAALFPLLPDTSVAARLIALELASNGQTVTRLNLHARAALMRDDDEPFSILSARKRKELNRQRRRLAEAGYLENQVSFEVREVRAAVAEFIDLEKRGWKGRAGSAVAFDPSSAEFMIEAVAALARERKVRVDRLSLDGRTIAAAITLYSGDYAWFWKIAYDEEFARYSPGVQLTVDLTAVFESDRQLAMIDSCAVADHSMIDHLWSGRLAMADWLVPLDGSLSFAAAAAAERARRMLIAPAKALRRRLRR